MQALYLSEMLAPTNKSTRRYNPNDQHGLVPYISHKICYFYSALSFITIYTKWYGWLLTDPRYSSSLRMQNTVHIHLQHEYITLETYCTAAHRDLYQLRYNTQLAIG